MAYPLLLHAKHHEAVAPYQVFGKWVVPWHFGSWEAEYEALRTAVGLIDYSTQALIEVQGADRVSFLHNLLTNDIKRLSPGTGCRAALLEPNAKLIADCLVVAEETSLWLMCDANRVTTLMQTLDHYLFSEQVRLINHERTYAVLALQGPRTMHCLRQVLGDISLPNLEDHVRASLPETPLWLIRHALTGGVGVLCVCPADEALLVWRVFTHRGESAGLQRVGWEALNTARLEAGIPWYGIDMDESNLLPETGLEAVAVSETKGCYVGQEIIARMQTYGSPNKRLMGFVVEGHQAPSAGGRIVPAGAAGGRDHEDVGQLTSACFSPALQRPIGMGYVKRGFYEPGTAVEILQGGTRLPATVVPRPIVHQT